MAVTPNSVITLQTPKLDNLFLSTAIAPGVASNVSIGSVNGTKITGMWASNSDAGATHLLSFGISRAGGGMAGCGAVTIPASAGVANGVPPVNLLSPTIWPGLPVDSDGNPFFFLQSTADIFQAQYGTTLTTGASINVFAVRGDF